MDEYFYIDWIGWWKEATRFGKPVGFMVMVLMAERRIFSLDYIEPSMDRMFVGIALRDYWWTQ